MRSQYHSLPLDSQGLEVFGACHDQTAYYEFLLSDPLAYLGISEFQAAM
jgi:hypothetical protein